jgi:D-alanine-D-alanine ligase
MKTKKIAVLMGGPSDEREVSLNTGRAILAALQEKGYHAVGIDLDPVHFVEQLKTEKIDVVFNAIHGKYGEDGKLQGALDLLGIPYTGSDVLASAVAMDKGISKNVFTANNIPTPRSRLYYKVDAGKDLAAEVLKDFGIPVVVKSAAQGSSIGVTIVESAADLPEAIGRAFKYSDNVLVEEFIKGKEVTAAVWGNEVVEALPVIEIVPHSGRYDYHSKYTRGATDYIVPARLDDNVTKAIQDVAVRAFKAVGCKGIARADLMLNEKNEPYVLELNTIPGMTATSLVPKAAQAAGIPFSDLCERLLLMVK